LSWVAFSTIMSSSVLGGPDLEFGRPLIFADFWPRIELLAA
jgi:hypothetical protein